MRGGEEVSERSQEAGEECRGSRKRTSLSVTVGCCFSRLQLGGQDCTKCRLKYLNFNALAPLVSTDPSHEEESLQSLVCFLIVNLTAVLLKYLTEQYIMYTLASISC